MKKNILGYLTTVIFISATTLTACGGSNSNTTNTGGQGNPSTQLSEAEVNGLLFMREEEELARDLYLDIYDAKDSRLTTY